jgi:asparagine N-glycosylation enzyme membrane subunit Stt3
LEDLALVVTGILLGFVLLGVVAVTLAILSRKGKLSKYWPLGLAVVLTVVAIFAWQGSDRLAMVPLAWAALTATIAFWPKSKK